MPYIDGEIIKEVKKVDALQYLKDYESYDLKRCGNGYCLKSHDSLKLSNGKWMWYSRGIGGRSAIDFLIKVRGYSFMDAVKIISENYKISSGFSQENFSENEKVFEKNFQDSEKNSEKIFEKVLKIPEKNETDFVIRKYLSDRKIDDEIVDFCIDNNLIFEEKNYHSVVFVGYDEDNIPRNAFYRSTKGRVLGDVSESTKDYSFRLKFSHEKAVHVFESCIDLLSYATIVKHAGQSFYSKNYLSLNGVSDKLRENHEAEVLPAALRKYLEIYPETEKIILHLDNDSAGRIATEKIKLAVNNNYEVIDSPPLFGKDVNDFLCLGS